MTSFAQLLRWLGPWTSPSRAPPGIERSAIQIDNRFEAWLYRPRRPTGAYLVAPGLHYEGPADPRMDRFCRVLAQAGHLVLAPFLPDYADLMVRESVIADLGHAFDALLDLPLPVRRPGVFSISFGSLPALRLAADPARRDRVGGLVVFGGFADFGAAIRHCLGVGPADTPRDPLNQPVVLMNLLEDLDSVPADTEAVVKGWRAFVEATWGRPEMKSPDRFLPVAETLGHHLQGDARRLYRIGVGLDPGIWPLCEPALTRRVARAPYLDPRPWLHAVECPVHVVHGLDDDVMPPDQLPALEAALPRGRTNTYLTGLYGHTGPDQRHSPSNRVSSALREGRTLIGVLRALSAAGHDRL